MDFVMRIYHRVLVTVSTEYLQAIMTQGADMADLPHGVRCRTGLPRDAVLTGAYVTWDTAAPILRMTFDHPSFAPVAEGERIPEFTPVMETYRKTATPPL